MIKAYKWYMLFMFMSIIFVSTSMAQTIMTDKPVDQKIWEVGLKVLFPALWTAVAPWVTGIVTSSIKQVPTTVQVVISSILGAVMAGVAGAIPDFPLTVESAATMGAAGGGTGQVLANMNPETIHPKTSVVQTDKKTV